MMVVPAARYHHRYGPDGSIESICLYCFLVVASGKSTMELAAQEEKHECVELQISAALPLGTSGKPN